MKIVVTLIYNFPWFFGNFQIQQYIWIFAALLRWEIIKVQSLPKDYVFYSTNSTYPFISNNGVAELLSSVLCSTLHFSLEILHCATIFISYSYYLWKYHLLHAILVTCCSYMLHATSATNRKTFKKSKVFNGTTQKAMQHITNDMQPTGQQTSSWRVKRREDDQHMHMYVNMN